MKALKLVVEGADGAGKSTLARAMAVATRATVMECPEPPFRVASKRVNAEATPESRLMFFLAANLDLSHRAQEAVRDLVVVRYIWSSIAYHSIYLDIDPGDLTTRLRPVLDMLWMPDVVVYLSADPRARLARITERADESQHQRDQAKDGLFQTELHRRFVATLDLFDIPVVSIRTDSLSVEQTFEIAWDALSFYG